MKFITLLQAVGDTLQGAIPAGIQVAGTKDINVWDLILGYDEVSDSYSWTSIIVMAILFALSIISVYIFIERTLAVKKAAKEEHDFMNKIREYIHDGKLDSAKDLCARTNNPSARMIEKGIARIGKPMEDIKTSIENVGKLEVYKLEQKLSFLATASGAAPMIGFLGTTLGMISTFNTMKNSPSGKIEIVAISGGIMEAMITTVGGLIVGIIAYMGYNYLVAKVGKVIHQMEGDSLEFMDVLHEPGK